MKSFHLLFAQLYLLAALLLLLQPLDGGCENPPHPTLRKGRDHALFFAVSDYKDSKFDRLKNPVTNARAIASVLSSKYGFDTTVVVNPTLRTIDSKIAEFRDKFAKNVDGRYPENGQLIIYFSGHGMLADYNGYFIPSDGDPYSPITSAFAYKTWRPVITAINCKHILVAIDACYSSSFSPKYGTQADPVFTRPGEYTEEQKIISNHDVNKTRIFFTSDAKEKETPDLSNFALKFLQGLNQNSSSFLTSTQLYSNYIDFAFPKAKAGDFEGDGGGAFLFFLAQTQTDTDGDGVPDARDECPRLYGKTPSGCPDADEDGIPDPKDNCPYESGPASNGGCPTQAADGDGDGIPDVGDACPTEKGLARFAGCPDTDSDGIPDKDDNCPEQSGPASNRGCPLAPDRDRDGVPDNTDRCPDQFGPASNNGCPLPAAESSYNDPYAGSMVWVKGGTFQMGDANGEGDEKPVHSVTLSGFYIGKTEVTQAQWKALMGTKPSYNKNCDQCPVEQVNWDDAQEFIKKLNAKTGKTYRLPTEAEWEYAARGGKNSSYAYAGSDTVDEVAWYGSNSGSKTHPIGQKKANELGLSDMSGNVREWCQDWYGSDYYGESPSSNPTGPDTGSYRVIRGGSWDSLPAYVRVAIRRFRTPDYRNAFVGFRLARQQ